MNLLIFFIIFSIFLFTIKTYLVKHYHKEVYYFFLKYISTPFSQYQGKYFIDNFDTIIKPYFKGSYGSPMKKDKIINTVED